VFLNTKTQEAYDTEFLLIPKGEFAGVIQPFTKDSIRNVVAEDDTVYCVLDVNVETTDPAVLQAVQRKKAAARGSIFLDVVRDSTGRITALEEGKGKNVSLGLLREALGQNIKGRVWSISEMVGMAVFFTVDHSTTKKGRTVANITAFRKPEGRPLGIMV
jgi:hypothetical protein